MNIKTINRDIQFFPRTRKATRLINEALFSGVDIDISVANTKDMDLKIPMSNIEKSNEVTIKLLTDITIEEIDSLTDEEFAKVLEECTKKK